MTECLLKLCAHRGADRSKCNAPALRQSDYCRHHARVHRPMIPAYALEAGTFSELQRAMQRTLQDIFSGAITPKLSNQIFFELGKRIRALKPNNATNPASVRGV